MKIENISDNHLFIRNFASDSDSPMTQFLLLFHFLSPLRHALYVTRIKHCYNKTKTNIHALKKNNKWIIRKWTTFLRDSKAFEQKNPIPGKDRVLSHNDFFFLRTIQSEMQYFRNIAKWRSCLKNLDKVIPSALSIRVCLRKNSRTSIQDVEKLLFNPNFEGWISAGIEKANTRKSNEKEKGLKSRKLSTGMSLYLVKVSWKRTLRTGQLKTALENLIETVMLVSTNRKLYFNWFSFLQLKKTTNFQKRIFVILFLIVQSDMVFGRCMQVCLPKYKHIVNDFH
jgi:hypothetical protein